jgi:hypothetical protein
LVVKRFPDALIALALVLMTGFGAAAEQVQVVVNGQTRSFTLERPAMAAAAVRERPSQTSGGLRRKPVSSRPSPKDAQIGGTIFRPDRRLGSLRKCFSRTAGRLTISHVSKRWSQSSSGVVSPTRSRFTSLAYPLAAS